MKFTSDDMVAKLDKYSLDKLKIYFLKKELYNSFCK